MAKARTYTRGKRTFDVTLDLATSIGFLHMMANFRSDSRIDGVIENLCKVELASLHARFHTIAGGDNPYMLLEKFPWAIRFRWPEMQPMSQDVAPLKQQLL